MYTELKLQGSIPEGTLIQSGEITRGGIIFQDEHGELLTITDGVIKMKANGEWIDMNHVVDCFKRVQKVLGNIELMYGSRSCNKEK